MDKAKLNDLVTKARAGDQAAMGELVQVCQKDLRYYALKIVKKEDLADDAMQDSWMEIIQTIGNLRESAAFVTWSRRIVYHQCIKRVGKTRIVALDEDEDGETILDRIPDETPGTMPQEIVENQELRETLMDMLDQLSEGQRSSMMLYYYQRLAVKEIAQIQGENENTVKSQLYQGRRAMKKQVEAYEKKTGTKLHSFGLLPLLYCLFHWGKAESDAAAEAFAPQLQAALEPVLAANFGAGATTAAAAATAGGAATATGATAATAGGAFLSSIAVKLLAGVVAAALVVGGIVIASNQSSDPTEPSVPTSGQVQPGPAQPSNPDHTHIFDNWAFDDDAHWHICQCGEFADDRAAHTYADGECTVCRKTEPLPGGNEMLTFDCTTLGGHWIGLSNGYQDNKYTEFFVGDDGSLTLQGKTYYPIGSEVFEADEYTEWQAYIYFRDTPYDPAVGVTKEEMHQSSVWFNLRKMGENIMVTLKVNENPEDIFSFFSREFYRESDFFDYEQVALTMENFYDYVTVTADPIQFTYFDWSLSLMATQDITFTLREDLGYPSWFQISGTYQYSYSKVYYNTEDQTHEVDPTTVVLDAELNCAYYGSSNSLQVMKTNGGADLDYETRIVTWYGQVAQGITPETVIGYVFVPKQ